MRKSILAGFIAAGTVVFASELPNLRLPPDTRPDRYRLDLTLIPGEPTFQGNIEVDVSFSKPSSTLWLNASEIRIDSARFSQNGSDVAVTVTPAGKMFIGFSFPTPVTGKGTLRMAYSGKVMTNATAGVFQLSDNGIPYLSRNSSRLTRAAHSPVSTNRPTRSRGRSHCT